MARIKGQNTKPELVFRRALHAKGFRYRLHVGALPGKPDLVFPKYRAAVFIHGCFWHGHDCELFRIPATRPEFWQKKISGNRVRDETVLASLRALGWRTLIVWECATRGTGRRALDAVVEQISDWLRSGADTGEFRGD